MNKTTPAKESITVIGERNGLQLAIKIKHALARGLGEIISRLDLPDLIDGLLVEPSASSPRRLRILRRVGVACPVCGPAVCVVLLTHEFCERGHESVLAGRAFASGANSVQKKDP